MARYWWGVPWRASSGAVAMALAPPVGPEVPASSGGARIVAFMLGGLRESSRGSGPARGRGRPGCSRRSSGGGGVTGRGGGWGERGRGWEVGREAVGQEGGRSVEGALGEVGGEGSAYG
ncbi:hypothetical protein GCM10017776_34600 [Streptomyces griseoluteus]|nr:hypothetical protein GCM10017776_34600 [Streptomyces griseoluteus]